MATTTQLPDLHTAAGARWLARFLVVFLGVVLVGALMLVYPHVTG